MIFFQNLKLKVSHPRFLNVGSRESLDADFPPCLEKKTEHHYVQPDHNNISQPVFIFPEVSIYFSRVLLPTMSYHESQPCLILCVSSPYVAGHNYHSGNTIVVASLVSGCCSRKHFPVFNHIL